MCAVFYLILRNAIKEDLPVADAIYSAIQPRWGSCLFERDHDMITVLFGTRNMVWCEEPVLSKPLCSGLFLSGLILSYLVLSYLRWSVGCYCQNTIKRNHFKCSQCALFSILYYETL